MNLNAVYDYRVTSFGLPAGWFILSSRLSVTDKSHDDMIYTSVTNQEYEIRYNVLLNHYDADHFYDIYLWICIYCDTKV